MGKKVRAVALGTVGIAASAFGARAEVGECAGVGSLSERPTLTMGRIGTDTPRSYFIKNASEAKGCPDASPACRAKAFLVPGDVVVVTETRGAFVCADYVNVKGAERVGWMAAAAVTLVPSAPTTTEDWVGGWSRSEASITVKPAKDGALQIHGDATYGALDPDRVKRGAVNEGEIEGTRAPDGESLSFAMGDSKTLPVDKGDDTTCKVWMRRVGPYLLVDDNNQCGGMNVSFRGTYLRKR